MAEPHDPERTVDVPLASPTAGAAPAWFVVQDRKKVGPLTLVRLRELVQEGKLRPNDMVLREGTSKWVPVHSVAGLVPETKPSINAPDTPRPAGEDAPSGATGTFAVADPNATTAPQSPAAPPAAETREGVGTVIAGRYTLREVIGEGGMGSVFLADQTEPVKRQVALKLIKSGMDSNAVLARFDAERQALALMDHPNIARVYDGGTTPARQPFFVMELVNGVPITEYCDRHRLAVKSRLELFVQVCQAVQHAHQKGIIHRDLKPGNVLVTEVDGRPTPKVIDFGVAKATEQKLTDLSFADVGVIVGTPAYMSPEQAEPSSMDIDTRTDVYALGVMLYELLAGSPPIDARQFKHGAILEMLRMVREVEPPRPSTKVSTAADLPNIAANRSIEPAKLAQSLRGELDWVVMKALEKDRARRYDTAVGLARDIQRYLADEVVEARPPSSSYRLKKFVRRHKGQVIAAGLVLFALLAGIAGTTAGLIEARRQERIARGETSEKEKARQAEAEQRSVAEQAASAEKIANAQAQKRLAQIEKANDILGSIFESLDPKEIARAERPLQAILVEKLDKAVAQLEGESIGDPLVVAAMQKKFGDSLLGLGEPGKAIVLQKKSLATRQTMLGLDHTDTLASMNSLAGAYQAARNPDLALPLFEQTLKLLKTKDGPEHPNTLTSMNNLAEAYRSAGKLDLALPLFEQTLKLMKAKLGPRHPYTLTVTNNLADAYQETGKRDLALPLLEETLKLRKAGLGAEHPDTLISMANLAAAYKAVGKLDLAVPLFEETLKIQKARLGPEHLVTLTTMNNLALTYQDAGKLDLALPLLEETLKIRKARFGPDDPRTLTALANLGGMYRTAGKPERSLPFYEEKLKLQKAKLGADHPETILAMKNLADAYREAGKANLALPLAEETLKFAKARFGPEDQRTFIAMMDLFNACTKAGDKARATQLLPELLSVARKRMPRSSPQLAGHLALLGLSLLQVQAFAEAEPLLRETLTFGEKNHPDHWATFNAHSMLGGALLGQKKYADAEPLLLKGYEGLKEREKTIPPQGSARIPEALDRLIELHTALNKPEEVKKWRTERAKYPEARPPERK